VWLKHISSNLLKRNACGRAGQVYPDLDHDPAAYPSLDDTPDRSNHRGEFARVDE